MGLTKGFNASLTTMLILAVIAVAAILVGRSVLYQPGPVATPTPAALPTETPAITAPVSAATIDVLSFPPSVDAASKFSVSWKINSDAQIGIQHTAVHYGTSPVPDAKVPSDYPGVTKIQSGTIPGSFSVELSLPSAGSYYFRAHAIVDGRHVWSGEKVMTVKATVPTQAPTTITTPAAPTQTPPVTGNDYAIEADDNGFYMSGSKISSLNAARDSKITIAFGVKTENVYYGGLDFRSSKFANSPKVAPGGSWTSPEIAVDGDFTISSYWPASGVKKADLRVVAT